MRIFESCAATGIMPENEDLRAVRTLAYMIEKADPVKTGLSFKTLLETNTPAQMVGMMHETGVLERILPGCAGAQDIFRRLTALRIAEIDLGLAPQALRRLCVLIDKAPRNTLALSPATIRRFRRIMTGARSEDRAGALGYRIGSIDALDAMAVRVARDRTARITPKTRADIEAGAGAQMPLRPEDYAEYNLLDGTFDLLESSWIASGFSLDRGELLALLCHLRT